ncbi:MAG: hypothetical protein IPL63_16155 [Saprospiraceae bacterium]|nr:hypothetical protein [Saprospiraceae bacterium]
MKKLYLLLFFLFWQQTGYLQDSLRLQYKGYVKNLQTMVFPGSNTVLLENLVHHRSDINWNISRSLTMITGIRNRIFTGNLKALNPDFVSQLQNSSDDFFPLSILWYNKGHSAIHTTFDRLFIEWNKEKWNIRIGRQRINWGINLAFNPNDIFNAYNFLDFDYEERPGVDAARVQYYYGSFSGLDLVIKGSDSLRGSAAALKWFFNTGGYDFQIIGGFSQSDYTMGAGWAGNIKNVGWKGEMTYFIPVDKKVQNKTFVFTTGVDYTFGSGWYIYSGYLFSEKSITGQQNILFRQSRLSARNLYPYEHNFLTQLSYQVSPIVSLSGAFIYSIHEEHPLVINPVVRINLSDRWDLDIIGQHFLPLAKSSKQEDVSLIFLRIKMSY